jgi:hypothetical protein
MHPGWGTSFASLFFADHSINKRLQIGCAFIDSCFAVCYILPEQLQFGYKLLVVWQVGPLWYGSLRLKTETIRFPLIMFHLQKI